MTTVYAVVFDPEGYCTVKGLYKTENIAEHHKRLLEEEMGTSILAVVPMEVEDQ